MMDTNTSVMQDRIGQLCREFKLPTMGVQSVARFTEAGHGCKGRRENVPRGRPDRLVWAEENCTTRRLP